MSRKRLLLCCVVAVMGGANIGAQPAAHTDAQPRAEVGTQPAAHADTQPRTEIDTQPAATVGTQPPAVPAAASAASQPTSGSLPEITVNARRAALEPRVAAFVHNITGPDYAGGLALWRKPVCPLVSGLPEEEGEFVLGRVSAIARAAGVPLAGEKCHANLYILVTAQPRDLLQAMDRRNGWFTFGVDTPPDVIDEFMNTPRTVRVVYRTVPTTVDGIRVPYPSHPIMSAPPVGPTVVSGDTYWHHAATNRLTYAFVYNIFRAFVVIDHTRMRGVSRGQFADYVAMVGLAQLKPASQLGDAPTILKLFEVAPEAAPAGMSDWDQAFLKSLYATQQISTQQRNSIAHAIVESIVH